MDAMEELLSRFGRVTSRMIACGSEGRYREYTVDTGRSYLHSDTISGILAALSGSEWIIKAAPAGVGTLPRLLIIAEIPEESAQ